MVNIIDSSPQCILKLACLQQCSDLKKIDGINPLDAISITLIDISSTESNPSIKQYRTGSLIVSQEIKSFSKIEIIVIEGNHFSFENNRW